MDSPCALCGLPAPPAPGPAFCCAGCRNVFEILSHLPGGPPRSFRDTDLFRAGEAAGLVAAPVSLSPSPPLPQSNDPGDEVTFRVEGMWCPSCAWWIEEMLRRTGGVVEARVSFAADRATVRYLPHRVSLPALLERVTGLGYGASRLGEVPGRAEARRGAALRLGTSAILTANLMMISMGLYGGFFSDLGPAGVRFLSFPQWLLATPVVFYGGFPILRRAGSALRAGGASMDLLIAVGSLSSYGYSLGAMVAGSLHLYFDTAATLVTLTLVGRAVEARLRERVTREGEEFADWAGRKACLTTPSGERWVAAADVSPGDELRVRPGERVPVDGRVAEGRGTVDESTLTGEARPLRKGTGDEVSGGALLVEGDLRVRALRRAAESAVGRLVAVVESALERKLPSELAAERLTRHLVPGVFFLAAATALGLRLAGGSTEEALVRALTVLVITCPCALGIAVPLAKVAAVRSARARGLLVQEPSALERLPGVDVVVFDKTGTLTEGVFSLREVAVEGVTREEALGRAASVELSATHPLAAELVRAARGESLSLDGPGEFVEVEGRGARGFVFGEAVAVGNRGWLEAQGEWVSAELARREGESEARGLSTVLVGWGGRARAVFSFGDALKQGASGCVSDLRRRGVAVHLVSGDSVGATGAAAGELGVDRFAGRALPDEKAALVRDLRAAGRRVAVVGDGVNDAAALAEADVGVVLGGGLDLLCRAADVVVLGRDPGRVADLFEHAGRAARVMRQNLFFAFFYNVLAVPLALSGLLNPMLAALAMLASSVTVVANTLRAGRSPRVRDAGREEGRGRG